METPVTSHVSFLIHFLEKKQMQNEAKSQLQNLHQSDFHSGNSVLDLMRPAWMFSERILLLVYGVPYGFWGSPEVFLGWAIVFLVCTFASTQLRLELLQGPSDMMSIRSTSD